MLRAALLLTVLALLALVHQMVQSAAVKAATQACQNRRRELTTVVRIYFVDHAGHYPVLGPAQCPGSPATIYRYRHGPPTLIPEEFDCQIDCPLHPLPGAGR